LRVIIAKECSIIEVLENHDLGLTFLRHGTGTQLVNCVLLNQANRLTDI